MRELSDVSTVSDDPLVLWVAQGMAPGVRAWANRGTVAVACPDLYCRDRLAIHGDAGDAVPLLTNALAEVGSTFRPIGDVDLIDEVVDAIDDLEFIAAFGWMDTADPPPVAGDHVEWLSADDEPEVAALLKATSPASYAWPGRNGVTRWAGRRDDDGILVATAAEGWSAPEVGFIAGVATDASVRGQGYATATCAVVVDDLVRTHGQAALMVDDWNDAAIEIYERLGMRRRHLATARLSTLTVSDPQLRRLVPRTAGPSS